MDNEIKRRVFLSGIIGTLIGVPIAVRLLSGKRSDLSETHYFSKTLKKYQSMLDVPIRSDEKTGPVSLALNPGTGTCRKYVILSKSLLPNEFSMATGSDPDTFLVREGKIFFDQTRKGQQVFMGGDAVSEICTPFGKEEKDPCEIAILFQNGRLVPGQRKSGNPENRFDTQFERLLALAGPTELSVGTRWQGKTGRLKPFDGYTTNYEVVGFDRIADRSAVKVGFSAKIPNIARLPGITTRTMTADDIMTNEHRGNAWFDLETGLLVRQEIEMETSCSAPKELYKDAADKGKLLHVKANVVVQLFDV